MAMSNAALAGRGVPGLTRAGEMVVCLDCPAGKTASKRKVLSTDSVFFCFFLFSSFLCLKTCLPAL